MHPSYGFKYYVFLLLQIVITYTHHLITPVYVLRIIIQKQDCQNKCPDSTFILSQIQLSFGSELLIPGKVLHTMPGKEFKLNQFSSCNHTHDIDGLQHQETDFWSSAEMF
jgi:hypothetical protein